MHLVSGGPECERRSGRWAIVWNIKKSELCDIVVKNSETCLLFLVTTIEGKTNLGPST